MKNNQVVEISSEASREISYLETSITFSLAYRKAFRVHEAIAVPDSRTIGYRHQSTNPPNLFLLIRKRGPSTKLLYENVYWQKPPFAVVCGRLPDDRARSSRPTASPAVYFGGIYRSVRALLQGGITKTAAQCARRACQNTVLGKVEWSASNCTDTRA